LKIILKQYKQSFTTDNYNFIWKYKIVIYNRQLHSNLSRNIKF